MSLESLEGHYLKLEYGFRRNLTEAIWAYSVAKGLSLRAQEDAELDDRLNKNPFTWKTILLSLQVTWIMGIYKLIDQRSKSSIRRFVLFGAKHSEFFSREALLARKIRHDSGFNDASFADEHLSECFYPTAEHFTQLEAKTTRFDDLHTLIRTLRNKVFAHDDLLSEQEIHTYFGGIINTRIEEFLAMANLVYRQIHLGLYFNGHKPSESAIRSFDELHDPQVIFEEVKRMSLN